MGICLYCNGRPGHECFSWEQAKIFCGITGPEDDEMRLRRKRHYNEKRAKELRLEAKALSTRAAELRKEAAAILAKNR